MVKFLIERPVAVVMAFLAFVIIGVVTYFAIPVSLLPAIDIPRITVRVTADNTSARELENTATAPVRRQLQQVAGLNEIHSETRDGSATIRMDFDYGVDIDLAFIAVNEKIDAAMNSMPRDMQRPKAIKASATDIPVLYIYMTMKGDGDNDASFLEMAQVADNSVRRRIEQMPEVAMVDVTGVPTRMIRVVPDSKRTEAAGITPAVIENALVSANFTPGSMTVREGYYEYNVNVANQLRTPEDVSNIYIRQGDRIIRLGDVAEVSVVEHTPQGLSEYNGKRAVTLAVIKQNDENIDKMKDELASIITGFENTYPQYSFSISRNQTDLLDYTISNLVQNLLLGLILVFLVTAVFMGDLRTPFVIGLTIVVALILTFLLFYLFKVSLNVVSLSGLILAVGMMIDNSVIVTENITQWRQRGLHVMPACDKGATEMITPLLSSSLTTIAVFVPLIFMSGIAGAIFTDQAFSITAGLAMSYIVGIMLLPVLYRLFFTKKKNGKERGVKEREWKQTERIDRWMDRIYNHGVDFVFSHKTVFLILTAAVIPLCVLFFEEMETERMPKLDHVETMARIEWNENITASENGRRVNEIIAKCGGDVLENSAAIGVQDYMLDDGTDLSQSDAEIYLRTGSNEEVGKLTDKVSAYIKDHYPLASVDFYPPDNIFEKIFSSAEPDVEVHLTHKDKSVASNPDKYAEIRGKIEGNAGEASSSMALREQTDIVADNSKMALYNVDPSTVDRVLRSSFKEDGVTTLRSFSEYLPVVVSGEKQTLEETLAGTMVTTNVNGNNERSQVPLSSLVSTRIAHDFREIHAGKNGEYLLLAYEKADDPAEVVEAIETTVKEDKGWEAEISGAFFSNSEMMREMILILMVSIILMYFILCAQFESFVQPLIVLLEIPLDTAFALLTLWACGHTLNIMSAIGIIVTCGIVVNDSILKLDAINTLRSQGMPLLKAIHTGGSRRLRPILMTSLTTILAMVPLLFSNDMGSQLQRPLAIAMIGSMVVGTLVSVFIIPLIYWLIYKKDETKTAKA